MTSPGVDVLYHFIPLLAIVFAMLVNQTVSQRTTRLRSAADANRLRCGLRAELAILQSVYEENLRALDGGKEFLMSCRQMLGLYRGNLGRMQLLREPEVPAVVAAYGFVEVIECVLSATCKTQGHSYRALSGETPTEEIRQRYVAGCDRIALALQALGGEDPVQAGAATTPPLWRSKGPCLLRRNGFVTSET